MKKTRTKISDLMKKNLLYFLIPFLACFAACEKEEIVFDHELPAFEIKEGNILLEVIVPRETVEGDAIYIAGAFNGGDEAAVGDAKWQLEKSTVIPEKWGIYLDPSTFVSGKTLADGYHFISELSGEERSALNESVSRTENPEPGTRTNIYVNKWASFFNPPPVEIEHDGYVVYVEDLTGWEAAALYCWGDAEVFGAWPGALPSGTETIGNRTYKYFDTGWDNAGKTINLILNNNNGGIQVENVDALKNVVLNRNYYFSFTADNAEVVDVDQTFHIYVSDNSGWSEIALYCWGDAEVFGGWPGTLPTGKTITSNGVEYKEFELPAEAIGKSLNLIFNNNNGGEQAADINMTEIAANDIFISLDGKTGTVVNPSTVNQ